MSFALFRRSKPVPTPVVAQVKKVNLDQLFDKVKQLPAVSETVIRAMAIANDPNYRFSEFVDVIRRDGAITALLLKVANSVVFGGGACVDTVEKAVLRLGMRQCDRMVTAFGMKGAFRPKTKLAAHGVDRLWKHSLLTASLAMNLNKRLALGFGGEEYTAAMLHDIGRIVILVADEEVFNRIDPLDFNEKPDILIREKQQGGIDHAEVGEEYALRQKFPLTVRQAIRYHHIPLGANSDLVSLCDLINLADNISNHVLRERKIANYDPWACESFKRILKIAKNVKQDHLGEDLIEVVKVATRETREALKLQQ